MNTKLSAQLSKLLVGGLVLYFIYIFITALSIVDRRHIGTKNGTYINSTTDNNPYIAQLADRLTSNCKSDTCRVQYILDYVTTIPYKINHINANSPQETIQKNFGDCDDKSNLLISLLHELNIESYFVLVPKHIFVIVALDDGSFNNNFLGDIKGLYLNGKKFYILESTAKGSSIGFPFRYKISDIEMIMEPFENREVEVNRVEWRL